MVHHEHQHQLVLNEETEVSKMSKSTEVLWQLLQDTGRNNLSAKYLEKLCAVVLRRIGAYLKKVKCGHTNY